MIVLLSEKELEIVQSVLTGMENKGIYFDYQSFKNDVLLPKIDDTKQLMKTICSKVGRVIDFNSNYDIIKTFNKRGINIQSMSLEWLQENQHKHELIKLLLNVKESMQFINYYGQTIPLSLDDNNHLHGHWNINGANTGRMSCKDINLQGIKRICRPYFKAHEGNTFIMADYSNIELRILASLSNEKTLIDSFNDGIDVHRLTASKIFNLNYDSVSKLQRDVAKKVNFGIVYGVTAYGLQKLLLEEIDEVYPIDETEQFRSSFFEAYPKILPYLDSILKDDRYSFIENPNSRMNYPIQSSGAIGLKKSIVELSKNLRPNCEVVNLIHDEIIMEVPLDDVDTAKEVLVSSMVTGMKNIVKNVDIKVDVNVNRVWSK